MERFLFSRAVRAGHHRQARPPKNSAACVNGVVWGDGLHSLTTADLPHPANCVRVGGQGQEVSSLDWLWQVSRGSFELSFSIPLRGVFLPGRLSTLVGETFQPFKPRGQSRDR